MRSKIVITILLLLASANFLSTKLIQPAHIFPDEGGGFILRAKGINVLQFSYFNDLVKNSQGEYEALLGGELHKEESYSYVFPSLQNAFSARQVVNVSGKQPEITTTITPNIFKKEITVEKNIKQGSVTSLYLGVKIFEGFNAIDIHTDEGTARIYYHKTCYILIDGSSPIKEYQEKENLLLYYSYSGDITFQLSHQCQK